MSEIDAPSDPVRHARHIGYEKGSSVDRIYFDWNATTPPAPEVLEAMREAAENGWANPASIHGDGRRARAYVETARESVAALVGADARDVLFTSGGTEANNLALRSAFPEPSTRSPDRSPLPVLVVAKIEHPSVVKTAEQLEREGRARVRWLAVLPTGHVDAADAARAIAEGGVRLVALAAVNHETGAIQPVDEIGALLPPEASLHVDAVQAVGKVETKLQAATTIAVAAHKIRGPKGIGALVTRPCVRVSPILMGGAQERGLRPGTVDPIAAAGFAVATQRAQSALARYRELAVVRDRLERELLALAPGSFVNGEGPRASHVTNVSFARWRGPELVAALDLEGMSVSSGSACSAGTADPSPVIEAMAGRARAESAVRFSLGETTTLDDVARALAIVQRVLARAS